jgi:hypothetical protein
METRNPQFELSMFDEVVRKNKLWRDDSFFDIVNVRPDLEDDSDDDLDMIELKRK